MKNLITRLALTVATVLSFTACSHSGKSTDTSTADSPSPSPAHVITTRAVNASISPSLVIAGVIAPYRQIGIAANLAEPIAEVDVQEGDHVHAGQVLAKLQIDDLNAQLASSQRLVNEDVAKYRQTVYQTGAVNGQDDAAVRSAQAALHQAQVNLKGARTDLQRYVKLQTQGYLPALTVDQERTTVATDVAAMSAAEATLAQAQANYSANGRGTNEGEQQQELQGAQAAADAAQATVEQLRREIARAIIVAPVDGVVNGVNANPGEYPSGRQLFTIEQVDSVFAVLPSSSSQAVQIHPGATASVQVPNSSFKANGVVTAVLDQVAPGTTNFTVKVLIPNTANQLHAGMPVTATVQEPVMTGIRIPVSAFVDDTRTSIYIVRNGTIATQKVTPIQDDGTNAIVSGLSAGTSVVRDVENSNAGNGDKVTASS